jgi:hypothetical protein
VNCVILQPSYVPWRGYFDQIRRADVFVFYDDVQYDARGWRNRNRVKTPNGSVWLTVPVHAQGAQTEHTPIRDIRISWGRPWNRKHWATIESSYRRAPHFERYRPVLAPFWESRPEWLADFTIDLTVAIARELGIGHTRFLRSSELGVTGTKTERLLAVLAKVGADRYLSGPSARDYIDAAAFERAGIGLEYMVYDYPEYPQLHPPYDPQVSILDLLFMTGPEAGRWIWGEGAGA